jgi:hypothetical protein
MMIHNRFVCPAGCRGRQSDVNGEERRCGTYAVGLAFGVTRQSIRDLAEDQLLTP